jgi:hypothetical protein
MTGKVKKPNAPQAADPLHPPQQMADDGSLGEAESFANIEPDGVTNFANINPAPE